MICKKCGAKLEDNATECRFCGAVFANAADAEETKVIDTDAVKNAENKPNTDTEAEESLGVENEDGTEELFDENAKNRKRQLDRLQAEKQSQLKEIERRREDKRRKQKRNRVLIVAAAVICLGAIGGGIYYVQTNPDEVPNVVIATREPERETPDVVVTEAPSQDAQEAGATDPASWKPSDGTSGTSANRGTSGGTAAGSSGTAANSGTATKRTSGGASGTTASAGAAGTGGTAAKSGGGTASGGTAANNGTAAARSNAAANSGTATGGGAAAQPGTGSVPAAQPSGDVVTVDGYVFPNSSTVKLTEADLAGKSAWELRVARNEIYARHGRKFKDAALQNYFNGCPWYRVSSLYNYENDAANLNSIEQENANFIKKYELSHR